MTFSLKRNRIDKIPREKILAELRRVAEHYGNRYFTGREFNSVSELCKRQAVMATFGSWDAALEATGLELRPHKNHRKDRASDQELFVELERIWQMIGHRPSRAEWEASSPKFHYSTYKLHFGTWINACARFIDSKSGAIFVDNERLVSSNPAGVNLSNHSNIVEEDKRNIPLKLRLTVLDRDGFTCVLCGRSPATQRGVELHIDHSIPFSKGGKTVLTNLRTLCRECNLGKGSDYTSLRPT